MQVAVKFDDFVGEVAQPNALAIMGVGNDRDQCAQRHAAATRTRQSAHAIQLSFLAGGQHSRGRLGTFVLITGKEAWETIHRQAREEEESDDGTSTAPMHRVSTLAVAKHHQNGTIIPIVAALRRMSSLGQHSGVDRGLGDSFVKS